MLEIFLALPLKGEVRVTKRKRRQPKKQQRLRIKYTGKFVAVKDFEYEAVAKQVDEQQVGINLHYLIDTSIIVGYRNSVGHYLRRGADARPKQKVVQAKPKKVAKIGKGSTMYES